MNSSITSSGETGSYVGSIVNTVTMTISGSTFTNNTAAGGAIQNAGTLQITTSTFQGNTAAVVNGGTATITNSTFASNNVDVRASLKNITAVRPATISIKDSIIQGNAGVKNCAGPITYAG